MTKMESCRNLVNHSFRDVELIGLFIPYLIGLGVEVANYTEIVFYILWPVCMLYMLVRFVLAKEHTLAVLKKKDIIMYSAFCFFSLFSIVLHEGPLYYLTAYIIYTWILFVYQRTAFEELPESEVVSTFRKFAFFAAVVQGITAICGIVLKFINASVAYQAGRFQGVFGNPNTQTIAAAGGILCALIVYLLSDERRTKEIVILALAIIFNLIAILLSQGRGAILALSVSAFVWLVYVLCEADKKTRVRILTVLLVMIVLAVLVVAFVPDLRVSFMNLWHRFFPENGETISSSGRVEIWTLAIKQLNWKNIWLGIGPSNLGRAGEGQFSVSMLQFSGVHNIPLQILVVHGLLAFVFCYAFFIEVALTLIGDSRKCMRKKRSARVSDLLLLLLYTVEGCFGNPVFLVTSLGVTIVVMSAAGSYFNEKRVQKEN